MEIEAVFAEDQVCAVAVGVPANHLFVERYEPDEEIADRLFQWLQRQDSQ